MNIKYKNLLKASILIFIALLLTSIVITILYYFDIINNNIIKYLKMFSSIAIYFIGGLYIGKKSENKGYINGLKLSGIFIFISFILSVIFNNFKISRIIYFFISAICITFGAMIGVNKKEE